MSRTPANKPSIFHDLSFESYQHVQLAQGELGSSVVIPTFPSNPCMAVSCPPVLQRLELGAEAYVETPHRMKFCYTISLSTTVQYIYQYITILQYYMSLLYQIISLMWMLVWRLFVYAHVYCKLFDEQPWYRVLGFLVVGVVQTDAQIGNSVLVPSSSSSGILGLLPSTSPYDIIDDDPTWVNFKGMKTPQVSLMDCPDS